MQHQLERLRAWLKVFAKVPWISAAQTLIERVREDRLALTASSLTFTTTIALVPFITVALAVFTAFPMFADFQVVLQKWLIESLVPETIARQVLGYLNQFAGKASKLGGMGLVALLVSALALVFTIDRTLNAIWRVREARPFAQRLLIFWACITLGPVLLALSISMTSYVLSASRGMVGALPGGVALVLELLQVLMLAAGMAAMFRFVPNTHVRWGHAWIGGLFVAIGIEIAKRALTLYVSSVPTYSVVYGAFATVPILLIWIYVVWLIVLLGAALTAYLPSLIAGGRHRQIRYGWQLEMSLETLRQLELALPTGHKGLTLEQLCTLLHLDPLRLEPVLDSLIAIDWIGQLRETNEHVDDARYVLLINPDQTTLEALAGIWVLAPSPVTEKIWSIARWRSTILREVL